MALSDSQKEEVLRAIYEESDISVELATLILEDFTYRSYVDSVDEDDYDALENSSSNWQGLLNTLTINPTALAVFTAKYAAQIADKINGGGSFQVSELDLIIRNKDDFNKSASWASQAYRYYTGESSNYIDAIISAIIDNPDSIPINSILKSGSEFDIEGSKKLRDILDTTGVDLRDLHHVGIIKSNDGTNKYALADGASPGRQATEGTIEIASFDSVANGNAEIAELKNKETKFTKDLGGGQQFNVSNIRNTAPTIFEAVYKRYVFAIFSDGTNPLDAFNNLTQVYATDAAPLILKDFENDRRIELWTNLVAANADGLITADEAADALNSANAAALSDASDAGLSGRINETDGLSDADIEKRQRFFQQCVLLLKMNELKEYYSNDLTSDTNSGFHDSAPYNDRFYMITDGEDNSTFVNTLIAPKGDTIRDFMNITPDIQAFLVPKIRLFKVYGTGESLNQVEFVFRNNTYENNYMSKLFSDNSAVIRGSGYGIKEVSIGFEGTSPATAKNDIKFGLKLYFQDFQDFVKRFNTVDSKGEAATARFVDLILFDQKENPQVTDNQLRQQYDPQYYRIRADIGWQVPDSNDQQFVSACNKRGLSAASIKNAIVKMNKSFYLTMVEHNLDFDKTGAITITADYRAYIESQLKSTRFDALSDPTIVASRKQRQEKLAAAQKACTPGEIAQLKSIYNGQEKAEIATVQKRIINKLFEKNKIFNITVTDDGGFRESGVFSKIPEYYAEQNPKTSSGDSEDLIQFFYLGDLFYIILDSMYGESGEPKIDKTKFILPSIELEAYLGGNSGYTINVAEIPISINYFKEWYTQTVVKPQRKSYAIMYFIRDLLNNLVVDALIDTCFNRDYVKSFRFDTTTVTTNGDVLSGKASSTDYVINIADPANSNLFPLTAESSTGEPVDIADLVSYVFIIPVYNTITNKGLGNYYEDINRGVYHFEIGADRGILNEVKFSKIDMEYIREARFEQSRGVDDLLQLAAVYKASLNLFGNTLFYPGMTLFINPFGIGGLDFIPSDPNSIANKLGLGGYHLVTRVNSIISNGSFKTDVEAMFVYPGDGITRALVQGNNQPKDNPGESVENTSQTQSQEDAYFCDTLIRREADYLKDITRSAESDENNDIAAPTAEGVTESYNQKQGSPQSIPPPNAPAQSQQTTNTEPQGTILDSNNRPQTYYSVEVNNGVFYYYDQNGNLIVSY